MCCTIDIDIVCRNVCEFTLTVLNSEKIAKKKCVNKSLFVVIYTVIREKKYTSHYTGTTSFVGRIFVCFYCSSQIGRTMVWFPCQPRDYLQIIAVFATRNSKRTRVQTKTKLFFFTIITQTHKAVNAVSHA